MANLKSAIKRARQAKERQAQNQSFKSSMRSAMKAVEMKLQNEDIDGAKEAFSYATKQLDKAANRNIIHKNTAARHKAKLAKKINSM